MDSDVVISARGLGKKYRIGHRSPDSVPTLRDALTRSARSLARTTVEMLHGREIVSGDEVEDFWALRDVDFDIRRGEVVGIVGRNGAGKSTLLKVLSRITEPSSGEVRIKGRVASLLEVGTGFHPELSGRENVYLNGAILGMRHSEIRRKFDEIIDFAGIETFIDTPIKRYSSGMQVRLAFAVAAHLDSEILILDEVLAVGDAEFQKKFTGKVGEIAHNSGRTVLFVSHNMAAAKGLCDTGFLIRSGRLENVGSIDDIIVKYLEPLSGDGKYLRTSLPEGELMIESAELVQSVIRDPSRTVLDLHAVISASVDTKASLDLRIKDVFGNPVGFATAGALSHRLIRFPKGTTEITVRMDVSDVAEGNYWFSIDLSEPMVRHLDRAEDAIKVSIVPVHKSENIRALQQSWGYGAMSKSLEIINLQHSK